MRNMGVAWCVCELYISRWYKNCKRKFDCTHTYIARTHTYIQTHARTHTHEDRSVWKDHVDDDYSVISASFVKATGMVKECKCQAWTEVLRYKRQLLKFHIKSKHVLKVNYETQRQARSTHRTIPYKYVARFSIYSYSSFGRRFLELDDSSPVKILRHSPINVDPRDRGEIVNLI